ncbi:hypothetical protein ACOBV8_20725 (plasmid) [Pseudoalteromonas espejiana]
MYQLHTVAGVYVLIPLILIAFTGMAFNWKNATQLVFGNRHVFANRAKA